MYSLHKHVPPDGFHSYEQDGTGTAQNIFFAFKIFEYTYNPSTAVDDFGPNAMVDKWGNWIITGKCAPGDLLISVSQTVGHK